LRRVTPFSHAVRTPDWRAEAESWIHARLADLGLIAAGPVDQRRVRPWSTQLVVPTDSGNVWFKANCAGQAFEPALQTLLARLAPDEVDAPLATDPDRAWMLTRDRGATLAEHRTPTLADWERVVVAAGRLQRLVAGHRADLLASGLPDCSPDTVPARLERMIDLLVDLPADHPAHLGEEVADRLCAAREAVRSAARTLSESPLPATLQHGDLHPANLFAVDGRLQTFDFGDAQWADPLESLCVPWGATHDDASIPWDDVVSAYHEPWHDVVARDDIDELLSAAVLTQPVNRAFTWWECLADASADEWQRWGGAVAGHLSNVLEPWE
jgi:Phosphotransferase enzyme family